MNVAALTLRSLFPPFRTKVLRGLEVAAVFVLALMAVSLSAGEVYADTASYANAVASATYSLAGGTPVTTRSGNNGSATANASDSATPSPIQTVISMYDFYTPGTNPDGTQSTTGYQPATFQAQATGTGTGSASAGSVHADATASYSLTPYTATAIWTGATGTPTAGQADANSITNPYNVGASGIGQAEFQDTFTVQSSTLPKNALVDAQVSMGFDATLQNGDLTVAAFISHADTTTGSFEYLQTAGLYQTNYPATEAISQTQSQTVQLNVGETYVFGGWVSVDAAVPYGSCAGAIFPADKCGSQSSFADASNTANFFLDPLTQDISFNFASGHDYSTPTTNPVPEPESYAMLLTGLGLLAFSLRRRKI